MIRGEGMKTDKYPGDGNLFVKFNVKFPKHVDHLEPELMHPLMKILNQTNGLLKPETRKDKKARLEKELAMLKEEERHRSRRGAMDVDDEYDEAINLEPVPTIQLGPPPHEPKSSYTIESEERYLEDVDTTGGRGHGATREDDEEDGIPAGGQRMQCASQ